MFRIVATLVLLACLLPAQTARDATFGTVVGPVTQGGVNYLIGGASDIVLDEARGRLYLVNPGQRRVEAYSTGQRRFLSAVQTDATPLSAAMSADGNALYVTCFDGASLNVIDLTGAQPAVTRRVSLPAKPEGVAVGLTGDGLERVLLTTIGTGQNNTANVLLVFDPSPEAISNPVSNVIVTPPPPASPLLPPPAGRVAFAARTNLIPTQDRRFIIGFAATSATNRALFVYSAESGTVLRSRQVNESSSVLSVSPDGKKFMAGLRLFDAETLQVMAQQNAANLPHALPQGANFNVQQNQGGSVFSPDGGTLFSAFNFAPVQTPPARANVSQLLINDPDNLLTHMAVKMPENLSGNMVISSDGGTIYALSESGFLILPIGRLSESPLAAPERRVVFLASDQCGVTAGMRSAALSVRNVGAGRLTVAAQETAPATGTTVVVAPGVRAEAEGNGGKVTFNYSAANARGLGTVTPHNFTIVSSEAVNIPGQVRVYQNMRDSEARADVIPVEVGPVASEGLVDLAVDAARQRIYIANAGLNRVEIFDMNTKTFLAPVKVGQRPRSVAITPDGYSLWVANAGGESIFEIDLDRLEIVNKVRFPALPFNSGAGILTPAVVAATERGLMIIMSNGTLWKIVDGEAMPRPQSAIIGSTTVAAPFTMAATPTGEFLLLLAGTGQAYLYDALSDEFVQTRQVFNPPIIGAYGPISAGPRGAYFVVNGTVLNQALSVVSAPASVPVPGGRPGVTVSQPIAAVAAIGATSYARFVPPLVAANALPTTAATVELVDPSTGQVRGAGFPALESMATPLVANNRVNLNGRLMAVDGAGTTAYVLTTSGLSIVPLQTVATTDRPAISQNGIVSFGSQLPAVGQGGLISIYGRNLGPDAKVSGAALSTSLGNMCVTINNVLMPLSMTSPGQMNAQLPVEVTPGRYAVVVRNLEQKLVSANYNLTVSKYAPAVLMDAATKRAAIYHLDGSLVTPQNKARRDERIHIFATGLGAVKGVRLVSGQPAPETPEGVTDAVKVYFDLPTINEAEMDVEESVIVPGLVGVYRIQIYVPWYRRRGDALLVTLRMGNVDSPSTGPAVPTVAVE